MIKHIFIPIRSHFWFKAIVVICVGFIFCMIQYDQSDLTATATLTLSYPRASQGKHLNGTRINLNQMKEEEVLNRAIEKAGIVGETDSKTLAQMLSILPLETRKPEEQYIATEYRLNLTMEEKIAGVQANSLLEMILVSYIEMTYEKYVGNYAMIDFTLDELSNIDYSVISSMLETKAQLLGEYMSLREQEDGEFLSSKTNESFASLRRQINELSNIILEKYKALITNNGLSKNIESYSAQLNYQNIILQNSYDKYMLEYTERLDAISSYQNEQTAVVMIPTEDLSNEFYMSKTKIGIDYLSKDADKYMNLAEDVGKEISANKEILENMGAGKNKNFDIYERADEFVKQMTDSLTVLEEKVRATDEDYIHTKLSRSFFYSIREKSDTDKYAVKKTILLIGAFYIALLMTQSYLSMRQLHQKKELYDA